MFLIFYLGFSFHLHFARAQPIQASTNVPPLQWINLTPSFGGSIPPPLKDASIGYDPTRPRLLIFGGESAADIVTQETYLLDMTTLQWAAPNPPAGLTSRPPARSAAVGGPDVAANYRQDYVMWGGKGSTGPLSDLWSFNFATEFWNEATISSSPVGPSPRWGASGGTDPTSLQSLALTTTLYVTGGTNGTDGFGFQDVWGLVISGYLAQNIQGVNATWQQFSPGATSGAAGNPKLGQAGTIMYKSRIVTYGGCNFAAGQTGNASCATQDSHFLSTNPDFTPSSWTSESACPAARFGAALAPNLNAVSSSFGSQVFLILGSMDASEWSDQGGLQHGEVAVLDTNGGTWARVLPSGDPSSNPPYPSPREGAAVLSLPHAVSGVAATDTLVFGGKETSTGKYLNELWLLRAYNGTISSTNQTSWGGYGNGVLGSGVSASGSGVTVQFLTQCATPLTPQAGGGGGGGGGGGSSGPSPPPQSPASQAAQSSTVSRLHKILSPVSIALLLPAVLVSRYSIHSLGVQTSPTGSGASSLLLVSYVLAAAAYGVGVAGFAISLTTTRASVSSAIAKRSAVDHGILFKTLHGKVGLALFAGLYAIIPIYLIACWRASRRSPKAAASPASDTVVMRERGESSDIAGPLPDRAPMRASQEGFFGMARRKEMGKSTFSAESEGVQASTPDHQRRPPSGSSLSDFFRGSWGRSRRSCDGRIEKPAEESQGFEVVNRPKKRAAGSSPYDTYTRRSMFEFQTALSDVSWMERRRDLHTMSEIDYALSHMTPTPGFTDTGSPMPLIPPGTDLASTSTVSSPAPTSPDTLQGIANLVTHAFIIFACVFCLITLFASGPLVAFIIFLIWTVAFYFSLVLMAWFHIPGVSYLSLFIARLRGETHVPMPTEPADLHATSSSVPTPLTQSYFSPYIHQPPYRRVDGMSRDDSERASRLSRNPRSTVVSDDDEDDDDRQREMEIEMARRDVSVITVPKRRLVIANE
ncbi:hypothetical protein BOTBODRAFT_124153 [Botryobasidium botryosum FD-172 SS1]|uniref:Uncharacterized protein n=1 Tax=Botryobasidium botryosum (strain FD-172 SS1) TaxID=930990 RepID=A0A067N9Q2_BOTB1|nr:hypothetical protein BOTBODRAFT_124153 [Botryobasidium botryosum FD-172 SS1]